MPLLPPVTTAVPLVIAKLGRPLLRLLVTLLRLFRLRRLRLSLIPRR